MKRLLPRLLSAILSFCCGVFISPSPPAATIAPIKLTSSHISEITLTRHGCYGSCPVYSVTLRADGSASYVGYEYVERIGSYHAQPYQFDFEKVANAIEELNFFELDNVYDEGWVDAEVVSTTVVAGNCPSKTVTTYNSSEPPLELWSIDTLIDGVVSQIDWEKD